MGLLFALHTYLSKLGGREKILCNGKLFHYSYTLNIKTEFRLTAVYQSIDLPKSMDNKMVLVVRTDLQMGKGKILFYVKTDFRNWIINWWYFTFSWNKAKLQPNVLMQQLICTKKLPSKLQIWLNNGRRLVKQKSLWKHLKVYT